MNVRPQNALSKNLPAEAGTKRHKSASVGCPCFSMSPRPFSITGNINRPKPDETGFTGFFDRFGPANHQLGSPSYRETRVGRAGACLGKASSRRRNRGQLNLLTSTESLRQPF